MEENKDLTLFTMTQWSLEQYSLDKRLPGVRLKIVLQRKVLNELMTTYIPSFLLMLITFATTFFKPIYFEAALGVNLTTMLVMTTIFMNVMQMLPHTAYIKMIDIWLVFCQLVPFTEVALLTAMEYSRGEDNSQAIRQSPPAKVFHSRESCPGNQEINEKENNVYWYQLLGERTKQR